MNIYLVYGNVVEFSDGKIAMFMPSQEGDCFDFGNKGECLTLEKYNDSTYRQLSTFKEIVAIYGPADKGYRTLSVSKAHRDVVWRRSSGLYSNLSNNELLNIIMSYCYKISTIYKCDNLEIRHRKESPCRIFNYCMDLAPFARCNRKQLEQMVEIIYGENITTEGELF